MSSKKYFHKILYLCFLIVFCTNIVVDTSVFAMDNELSCSSSLLLPSDAFQAPLVRGLIVNAENPFELDFVLDRGDDNLDSKLLDKEGLRLMRYFLTSLTVPDEELWVNLSPYEENRICPSGFSKTQMGQELLILDYKLKQLSSSFMYPKNELGREFWDRVNKLSIDSSSSAISVDAFNKVWIVPKQATVYETSKGAFIVDGTLEVMLEKDYLAVSKNQLRAERSEEEPAVEVENIFKELIVPAIEKEINEGENFANLRQIYNSMILALWYKQKFIESPLVKLYADKNKIAGVESFDQNTIKETYSKYMGAFEQGAFDTIKKETDYRTGKMIKRRYFSGGIVKPSKVNVANTSSALTNSKVYKNLLQRDLVALTMQANIVAQEEIKSLSSSGIEVSPQQIQGLGFGAVTKEKLNNKIEQMRELGKVSLWREDESFASVEPMMNQFISDEVEIFIVEDDMSPALYFENEGDLSAEGLLRKQLKPKVYRTFYVREDLNGAKEIYLGKQFLDFLLGVSSDNALYDGTKILADLLNRLQNDLKFRNSESDRLAFMKLLTAIQYSVAYSWDSILKNDMHHAQKYMAEKNEPFPVQVPVAFDEDGLLKFEWLRDSSGTLRPLMRNMVHNTWRMWMLNDHSVHMATMVDNKLVFGVRGKEAYIGVGAIDSFAGHTGLDEFGEPEKASETALRELSEEFFGIKDLKAEEGRFILDAYANGKLKLHPVGKRNGFANMRKIILLEDGSIESVGMGKEKAKDWTKDGLVFDVPFETSDLFIIEMDPELVEMKSSKSVSDMEAGESFSMRSYSEWRQAVAEGSIEAGPSSKKLLGVDEILDPSIREEAAKLVSQESSSALKHQKGGFDFATLASDLDVTKESGYDFKYNESDMQKYERLIGISPAISASKPFDIKTIEQIKVVNN